MNGFRAVTASAGVICLIGALLIATVGRMQWPRVAAALVLTGVAGVLNTTIGPTIRHGVNLADHRAGEFIGAWTGTAVFGLIGVAVIAVTGFWIYQGRIDMRTLGATALVPPTITLIPGAIGTVATTIVGLVPWVIGAGLTFAFGLG